MALSCGIVGLPNVGKSTIFNALTRSAQALAANYPFATIEPNVGEVPVPDPRLAVLAGLSSSRKLVPASMRFVDIAGLVRGAASGQGLGNAFLSHIRETDAVAMVVRCFEDGNVTHVEGEPDPLRDIEIITIEMALADLASLTRRRDKLQREVRANPKEAPKLATLENLIAALESNRPARAFPPGSAEAALARESFLLTAKPVLYVANVDEAQINAPGPMAQAVFAHAKGENGRAIAFNGKIESEFAGMSDEDVAMFRADYGITSGGLDRLIVEAYDLLGPDDVPHHRRARDARLDDREGHQGAAGGGQDPQRHRARLHPRRVHLVRRLRAVQDDRRAARRGQAALRGQGLRDAGRRRGRVPLQRLTTPPAGSSLDSGVSGGGRDRSAAGRDLAAARGIAAAGRSPPGG